MDNYPQISIILPVYNERESLEPLVQEIYSVLAGMNMSFEVIAVDDGSTDGSREILTGLVSKNSNFRVIVLRMNFGKSPALAAGLKRAKGEVLITIDADLQDDPAEIPRFLEALSGGTDLVVGWKQPRRDPLSKTLPSKAFNWAMRIMSGVQIHDFNCGFKAFRRTVVEDIPLYGELHRFIPVFAARHGWSVKEIPIRHRPRSFGRSKFGLIRLIRGLFDFMTVYFITTFLQRPFHLIGGMGFLFLFVGFAIEIYMSVLWLLGAGPIGNRPLFFLGILAIIVGVQLAGMGLVGELVTNYLHKPEASYGVTSEHGFESDLSRDPVISG